MSRLQFVAYYCTTYHNIGRVERLYSDRAGPLSPTSLAKALTFAEVAVDVLLDEQQDLVGQEHLALGEGLTPLELYQAQGMVMVQLGISLTEAMLRIRGRRLRPGKTPPRRRHRHHQRYEDPASRCAPGRSSPGKSLEGRSGSVRQARGAACAAVASPGASTAS